MSESAPTTFLDIDPTPERTPIIPARKYGEEGEATLESLQQLDKDGKQHVVKYGRDAGTPCLKARISILTSEYGFVSIFDDWMLEGGGNYGKNRTLRYLAQLGVDPTATRDPQTGRSKIDLTSLEKSKIIVDVGYDSWDRKDKDTGEPTGEKGEKNIIKNVWKRP